jgi:hypothetical protein
VSLKVDCDSSNLLPAKSEEFPIKHECMSKKKCTYGNAGSATVLALGPLFLKSGNELVRELKGALDRAEFPSGGCLTQKRFAELIGLPKSTINDWYHSPLVGQIKGFLGGLERLSELERTNLLRQFCRDCFRLNDPRLAHDPQSVSTLIHLVQQPSGLAFISSRSDSARTFLISAMGNSAGLEVRACGLDMHKPDTFVPVNGVLYLCKPCSPAEIGPILRDVWPTIADSEAQLLLFNGIWSAGPDFRVKAGEMAKDRNVLIADNFDDAIPRLRDWRGVNASLISVDWEEREGGRLRVSIQGDSQQPTWEGRS